jgi:hypothetical protein
MDNVQLRQRLQELHTALEDTQQVDPETAAELTELDGHIQALLRRPDRELVNQHHGLTEDLRSALIRFELEHPNVALNIERVLDAFNEMGI